MTDTLRDELKRRSETMRQTNIGRTKAGVQVERDYDAEALAELERVQDLHTGLMAAADERCDRLTARCAELEAALVELVAVEDLEDKAEAVHFAGLYSGKSGENWQAEYDALRGDFLRRQPLAWQAARLALQPHKVRERDETLSGDATFERELNRAFTRCESRGGSDTRGGDFQCGLISGHDGDHSALIPSGTPWSWPHEREQDEEHP